MGTTLVLHWYYNGNASTALLKRSTGTPLVLVRYWHCADTALVLHPYCMGTTLELYRYDTSSALALHCHRTDTRIVRARRLKEIP